MKGLNLSSLRADLFPVAPEFSEKPALTIGDIEDKISQWSTELVNDYGEGFNFLDRYHALPLRMLTGFTFDELCKLRYSTFIMMRDDVEKLFETDAQYEIVNKIISSMWRWGGGENVWNEVVEAYYNLRQFRFIDDPDFEVRLDHSTYHNECGWSKYCRVYIDGAFAYLVYYKGKHVMTFGFSITKGRRILIQQVQLAQRTGNRFLYKFPQNRLEFAVDLFRKNFPTYSLYVISGYDLAQKTLRQYRKALEEAEESVRRNSEDPNGKTYAEKRRKDCELLRNMISHLESDADRIHTFYSNAGKYQIDGVALKVNGLRHFKVDIKRPAVVTKSSRKKQIALNVAQSFN